MAWAEEKITGFSLLFCTSAGRLLLVQSVSLTRYKQSAPINE